MLITYLPEPTFRDSVRALSVRHLHESSLAARQILLANTRYDREKLTLPNAVRPNGNQYRMWRNYDAALALYGIAIVRELYDRGKRNSLDSLFDLFIVGDVVVPPWYGENSNERERLIDSHRDILFNADPAWYEQCKWPGISRGSLYWPRYSNIIHERVGR